MTHYTLKELMEAALAAELVYHLVPDNIYDLINIIDHNSLDLPQMQFTGKRDMDGVDIYEDDIVYKELYAPDDPAFGFYGAVGIIKENPDDMGCFIEAVDEDDHTFRDWMGMTFSFDDVKVIGNIHENWDLLGK
jgi:uncharacterized phage protein (TIGR01671 family)